MIAVIDYDAGNTCSVINAIERIGVDYMLTSNEEQIIAASSVIFPGVGHAKAAMASLKAKKLDLLIPNLVQPVLGICVGMQLLFQKSEEGSVDCMSIIPGEVKRFKSDLGLKVPHMGWNKVFWDCDDPLLEGIQPGSYFYFVHSYYHKRSESSLAYTSYGVDISAIIRKNNFWGIQFHAEKSAQIGEQLIRNFIHNCKSTI